MKTQLKGILILPTIVLMLGATMLLNNCGSSSPSAGTASNYLGTASPGDVWNFSINRTAGTFTGTTDGGTVGTVAYTVTGTLAVLKYGFLKLTATAFTSGTQTAPTLTVDGTHNVAYAMEIPGVALLVQPIGSKSMITAVYNSATCQVTGLGTSTQPVALEYMRVSYGSNSTYDPTQSPVFGPISIVPNSTFSTFTPVTENDYILSTTNATYNQASTSGLMAFKYTYGASAGGATGTAATCLNGVISSGNTTGVIAVAPGTNAANAILLDNGQGQGGMVVMSGTATNTATTSIASVSFNGLVFKNNSNSSQPVRVTLDSTGTKATVYPIVGDPSTTTLSLGTAIGYFKIVSATSSQIIEAVNCSNDSTFTTCSQGPIGGFVSSPTGTTFEASNNNVNPLILVLTGKDGGTNAPFVVFAVNTQN